jgi:hypothetical protein
MKLKLIKFIFLSLFILTGCEHESTIEKQEEYIINLSPEAEILCFNGSLVYYFIGPKQTDDTPVDWDLHSYDSDNNTSEKIVTVPAASNIVDSPLIVDQKIYLIQKTYNRNTLLMCDTEKKLFNPFTNGRVLYL